MRWEDGPGAVRGGEGEGSERRHKMAAAPGAGPPDPCASVLFSCLQVAMATGQVLFHRFFYSKSFVKHSFEVSRAGAGDGGFLHPEMGREEGVVSVASLFRKGVVSFRPLYLAFTHRGIETFGESLRTRRWSLSPGALLSRICVFNQMESSCEIEFGSGFKIKGNKDFPGGLDGKAYNVVGPGYIPGSGRSFGEGNGNPHAILLPEKSHGQRSLVGYSPWGRKESDTTERLKFVSGNK